eukprot:10806476-Ditylum_brightwellii.AAC.1
MARQHKPCRNPHTGKWTYPKLADVFEKVGLYTISHYVQVRRQTIAAYIVDRPILSFCMEGERRHGTSSRRQFWWEQMVDWDLARASSEAGVAGVDESDTN